MKVKELERTVNIAWSPANYHPILLAAGTAAQQLDASFNTSASLDIYALNLSEPGQDLELKCSVPSKNRFHRVAWGGTGAGVVVGGCDGGAIQVYDASRIFNGDDGLVAHQDRHTGPVRAIHFNPFQLNLMATGAGESDIFIWDLNNISTPMSPGSKTQPFEDVLSLAWNKQVQHILASTFHSRCIVWDLRKNEPIIKLSDSNSRVRWKEVAWHPDVATQLCLASEDDALPIVQLWDLRFATSPLRSLAQHSRGVLSLAWCNQDSDLLVSSGKDNRILCWNPNADHPTGLVQCEIVNVQQMIFEVAWCPRNPNLIACASADGHTSIYNLTASQTTVLTSNKIADSFPGMEALAIEQPSGQQAAHVELSKPPKWMRRPCGASFAFGGRLVWFSNAGGASIIMGQIGEEDVQLASKAKATLSAMYSGKAADLCRDRSDPLWSFLGAAFDADPPSAIRALLGYPPQVKDNDDYCDNINGNNAFDMLTPVDDSAKENESLPSQPLTEFKMQKGGDGGVISALLVGDMKGAATKCLSDGDFADGLLLAAAAGPEVLASTQNKYFNSYAKKTSTGELIRAIVTGDWEPLVTTCDLDSWKEVLVAVLTYASPLKSPSLSLALGRRLEEAGKDKAGAEVCYVAAGSFAALIRHRIASIASASSPSLDTSTNLQELVEMVLVGRAAEESRGSVEPVDEEVSRLLTDYALLLAADGHFQLALSYLEPAQGAKADELRESLLLNLGLKQQPQPHAQEQRRPSAEPKPMRKFSHPATGREHFPKMSAVGAARTNMALNSGPPMVPGGQPMVPPGPPMPGAPSMAPNVQPLSPPAASTSPALSSSGGSGKKYLVDPSVGAHQPGGGQYPMGGMYSSNSKFPAPSTQPIFQPSGPLNPSNPNQMSQPIQQGVNSGAPPPPTSAQMINNSSAGWNDPPILSNTSRAQKRADAASNAAPAPITHPVYDPYASVGPPPHSGMRPDVGPPPLGSAPPPMSSARARPPSAAGYDPGPPPGGQPFGRPQSVGPPPSQFGAPNSQPPSQFGPPPQASQFGVPPPSGQLSGPPPTGNSFGGPPTPGGQFGGPTSSGGQFGGPLPPSGQFGGPTPPSGQFGGPNPPIGQFGGPTPPSGQFGGPTPPSGQFGAPAPPSGQFGGPTPPSGQFGGAPPPSGQFGGPPKPGGQFGGLPQSNAQFGGPPLPNQLGSTAPSGQFGGQIPPPSQFGPPPPSGPFGAQPGHTIGDAPPSGNQLRGIPPQGNQMKNAPPGNFGSQLPPSGMSLPPVQPAGPGIPPVQTSSAQSTPSSRGGRSSGRSTPHQVNGGGGYGDPPLSGGNKQPLPQSCQRVQDVLELLRSTCHATTNNPQMKRKLDDVARKLEILYDSLRESKLSVGSIEGLEAIITQLEAGDYSGALGHHSRMAAGPDFSHIAGFMPALKLLIQSALQLNVYLS